MANDCIPGVAAKYPKLTCLGRGERIGLFVRVQFCVIPGRIEVCSNVVTGGHDFPTVLPFRCLLAVWKDHREYFCLDQNLPSKSTN